MAFGKIHTATNFLMSAERIPTGETGWLPLTDFVTDGGGEYYSYYIDPGTPDTVKNTESDNGEALRVVWDDLAEDTVTYNGETYSCGITNQTAIAAAIVKLEGTTAGTTLLFPTATNNVVPLTSPDFDAILKSIAVTEQTLLASV